VLRETNQEESDGAFLGPASAFRYFDFRVTARPRRVHGSDDTLYMQAQYWPLRIAQHDERDSVNRQVLLVADIFVGSDQHIKSRGLSGF
jgi:hypothetical protein